MAIDVGLGDLVASLFFAGGSTAAADTAAVGAADLLGAGAVDAGAAAAADIGAGAAADLAAGAGAAEAADVAIPALTEGAIAGEATPAIADAAAAAGTPVAADAAAFLPAADAAGVFGDFGTPVGAANALEFAPTPAGTAAVDTLPQSEGIQAINSAMSAPAAATPVQSPAQVLQGDPNIAAFTGADTATPTATAASGPSTNAAVAAQQPLSTGAQSLTGSFGSDAAAAGSMAPDASGQIAAEGGISPSANAVSANAAEALANAPSSGNGFMSSVTGALSNPLLQLGVPAAMLGYNLLKGPAPIPPQAQEAVANAEKNLAPLQNAATQNVPLYNQTAATDLNLANNFQISPAQAASIDTWKQQQMNQLIQQIANQGNVNPQQTSEYAQGKNQIDQQALAMQTQMVNQLVSTAFQAASAANAGVSTSANVSSAFDATLMQAAQLQVQQDQAFQSAVGAALQSFGLIAGLNAGRFNKMANDNSALSATG